MDKQFCDIILERQLSNSRFVAININDKRFCLCTDSDMRRKYWFFIDCYIYLMINKLIDTNILIEDISFPNDDYMNIGIHYDLGEGQNYILCDTKRIDTYQKICGDDDYFFIIFLILFHEEYHQYSIMNIIINRDGKDYWDRKLYNIINKMGEFDADIGAIIKLKYIFGLDKYKCNLIIKKWRDCNNESRDNFYNRTHPLLHTRYSIMKFIIYNEIITNSYQFLYYNLFIICAHLSRL